MSQPPFPPSVWAAVTPPGPELTPLEGDRACDAVVIGGGFTGLSTALHLAEAGVETVLLEAVAPGWGASGRNNGQVIPTLTRPDPEAIVARHGAGGERLVAVIRDSAADLFDLVRRLDLQAEAEQTGWIQPVHTPGRIRIAEERVRQWSAVGAPVSLLSKDEVRELTGSGIWHGGWTNPTGGHINPLALSRELARAAIAAGAQLYGRTPAERIEREEGAGTEGGWIVQTPNGRVRARRLMLATNAYTGEFSAALAPAVAREVIPFMSWQMATEPVGDNVRRSVIPGRQAISDTHGDLYFTRFDARHRLITGGRLLIPVNGRRRLEARIGRRLERMFAPLGRTGFDYVWNGYIGMTTDFMPRFHRLGPGGFAWAGCNGRGVGLSVALGREFAKALQDAPEEELGFPLTEPTPLPAHGLLRRLAPLRLLEYRWRDSREI